MEMAVKSVFVITRAIHIFILLFILTGCQEDESIYVEIVISADSPPIFRLSSDENFETPANIIYFNVFSDEPGKKPVYWSISTSRYETQGSKSVEVVGFSVPLREVVYGVIPDGFKETTKGKATSLEPGAKYHLSIWGGISGVEVEVYFINKPGRYFGHSTEW